MGPNLRARCSSTISRSSRASRGAPSRASSGILESAIQQALPRRARAFTQGRFRPRVDRGRRRGHAGCRRASRARPVCASARAWSPSPWRPDNVPAISSGRPELICLPLTDAEALREPAEKADVIAIGPGLGRTAWARAALEAVLGSGKPLVVDADALNIIAESRVPARADWILTPHPGEAARLLGTNTDDIQHDRLAALDRLVGRYHGTVVLKGAGTLVGAPGRIPALCEQGNPGMATAGMGDVLTGTIAGILAQCRDPWLAARVGVLVHAMAGDAAARTGERGLLAGDLARELRNCVNL